MKSVLRVFILLWSLVALIGCAPGHDPIAEGEDPPQAKEVVAELSDFLSSGTEKTIILNRSQVRELLSAIEDRKAIPAGVPVGDDSTVAIKSDPPAIRRETGDAVAAAPGDTVKDEKPGVVAGGPTLVPEKSALQAGNVKETAGPAAVVPVKPLVEAIASPVVQPPAPGVPVPEGFRAEIVEPTTGAKFLWDEARGWWRSDEFESFLKGSKVQNDSFCWLLTANSQGAGASDVPEGWTFQALGNGTGVVIAPKGSDLTLVGETVTAAKEEPKATEREAIEPPMANAPKAGDAAAVSAVVLPVAPLLEVGVPPVVVTPVAGASLPEGFKAEITEPTTGAKFLWDRERGLWRSDAFETFLKGSKAQNDSFCWILTTNSQSAGISEIPEGWTFQAAGDGKTIVLAPKQGGLTAVQGGNADSVKGVDSTDAPVTATNGIQEGQGATRSEAPVSRGGAAAVATVEPIKEENPPIPAANPGEGSEETAGVPPMAVDPRIEQRKAEEAREVPNRDERSVMMPPGSALPDGRVLYAPSYQDRQSPATQPFLFPNKGSNGTVAAEKSGGAGKAESEENAVPGSPQGAAPGAPEAGAAPKPRPRSFLFKPKKDQANEVIPVEPKPSVKNSQDL